MDGAKNNEGKTEIENSGKDEIEEEFEVKLDEIVTKDEMNEGDEEFKIEEVNDKADKKKKRIKEQKVFNEMKKKLQTVKMEDYRKTHPPANYGGGVSGWGETHKTYLVEIEYKWDPGYTIH